MNAVVVDSCVIAKWILPELDSAKAMAIQEQSRQSGQQLIALDIAPAEVANAIWKSQRRKILAPEKAHEFLKKLKEFPLRHEPSEPLLDAAFAIAVKYDRSVYDALFLALSQKLGARAITSDEPMFNAVRADFPQLQLLRLL